MRWCTIALAAGLILAVSGTAEATSLFVSTGQTGAQVQVDVNHTQHWTHTVLAPVNGIDGGLFRMKRGSGTLEDITLTIFQGTFADFGTVTPMLEVIKHPDAFTQQFAPIIFQGGQIDLLANTTYTAVLASPALDAQKFAYFIKDNETRFLVDEFGNPLLDPKPGYMNSVLPEPMTMLAIGLGITSLGGYIRKRKRR